MSRKRLPACCSTSLRTSTYLSAGSQSTLDAKRTSPAVAINLSGTTRQQLVPRTGVGLTLLPPTRAFVPPPPPTPPQTTTDCYSTKATANAKRTTLPKYACIDIAPLELSYPSANVDSVKRLLFSTIPQRELPSGCPYPLSRGRRLERGQLLFQLRQKQGETADEGGGGGGQQGRDGGWPVFQDQPSSKKPDAKRDGRARLRARAYATEICTHKIWKTLAQAPTKKHLKRSRTTTATHAAVVFHTTTTDTKTTMRYTRSSPQKKERKERDQETARRAAFAGIRRTTYV